MGQAQGHRRRKRRSCAATNSTGSSSGPRAPASIRKALWRARAGRRRLSKNAAMAVSSRRSTRNFAVSPGYIRTTADVRQNVFDLNVFTDPQPGAKVSSDYRRARTIRGGTGTRESSQRHPSASSGSLVAMDPQNGDVLALANYPTYRSERATPELRKSSIREPNLAVTAPFEPGSVFKVITLTAALETTKLTSG